jgi:hypothetical protein
MRSLALEMKRTSKGLYTSPTRLRAVPSSTGIDSEERVHRTALDCRGKKEIRTYEERSDSFCPLCPERVSEQPDSGEYSQASVEPADVSFHALTHETLVLVFSLFFFLARRQSLVTAIECARSVVMLRVAVEPAGDPLDPVDDVARLP